MIHNGKPRRRPSARQRIAALEAERDALLEAIKERARQVDALQSQVAALREALEDLNKGRRYGRVEAVLADTAAAGEALKQRLIQQGREEVRRAFEIERKAWMERDAEQTKLIRQGREEGARAERTCIVTYLRNVLAANHPHLRDAYYHAAHNIDAGAASIGTALPLTPEQPSGQQPAEDA